jgi:hypothetical protein
MVSQLLVVSSAGLKSGSQENSCEFPRKSQISTRPRAGPVAWTSTQYSAQV